jgi:hypothetical protein
MRLLLILAVVGGCADPYTHSARMTPELIAARGTYTFSAARSRVFPATVAALKVLGYEIAFSDEPAGVIKTAPRSARSVAHTKESALGPSETNTELVAYTRSYAIQISDNHGQTRVEATPRLFQNGSDISWRNTWDLAGADGENQRWYQLFREIGSNLGTMSAPATPPAEPAPAPP